jgi:hypothetical protein
MDTHRKGGIGGIGGMDTHRNTNDSGWTDQSSIPNSFLQNGSRHRSMFELGESTSRLGESSSSVHTGHRRLLRLLRRRYLRSGVGRSGAAMRVLSRD